MFWRERNNLARAILVNYFTTYSKGGPQNRIPHCGGNDADTGERSLVDVRGFRDEIGEAGTYGERGGGAHGRASVGRDGREEGYDAIDRRRSAEYTKGFEGWHEGGVVQSAGSESIVG